MLRMFILALWFFCASLIVGQAFNNYFNEIKSIEMVEPSIIGFNLEIIDDRWSLKNAISVNILQSKLHDYFEEQNLSINPANLNLLYNPLEVKITIRYMNFYESEARNLFGKGILDIKIFNKDDNSQNEFTTTADIPLREKLRAIEKNRTTYESYELVVIEKLLERFITRLEENIRMTGNKYRTVTSVGFSIADKDLQSARDNAILSAMRNACSMAWGSLIDSKATMVDYGDVTEITEEVISGHVKDYVILEENIKNLEEKYLFIVIKSLIKQR